MKMISQQAICIGVCDWFNVFRIQIHEVRVITFMHEDILTVVAAIEDVITGVIQ